MGRVWTAIFGLFFALTSAAQVPDLDAIAGRLDGASLDFARAVDAEGFDLPLEYGSLRLERGILVPASLEDEDRIFELVFVGTGRLRVAVSDAIEARQLAGFTGEETIDAPVEQLVLISGDPALAAGLRGRTAVDVAPEVRAAADRLYEEWVLDAERDGFGAAEALLRASAGDALGREFLGLWFRSSRIGRGFYRVDPTEIEPVSLGSYELFEREDFQSVREKKRDRKNARYMRKLERKSGHSPTDGIGGKATDEDETCGSVAEAERSEDDGDTLEWIKTWISTRSSDAHPQDLPPGVEPRSYRIELELTGQELKAKGEAIIEILPMTDGMRVVTLELHPSLEVCEVFFDDTTPVSFRRLGDEVLVALPEPSVENERFDLTVRFAGEPLRHILARRKLKSTIHWYPHVGTRDRATYDVTLRWPEEFALLSSGRPVEEGRENGSRWTRRVLDVPTAGFSFEVGEFEVVEDEVGHMELVFGFHRRDREMTEEIRAEIIQVVKASILMFESKLGILPVDRMTVVVADRGFSQGLLGFVTLSESAMGRRPDALVDNRTSQGLRIETVAHEISHQWWGHVVGWETYRDQWLSEALASFSAAKFMGQISEKPDVYHRGRAEMWRRTLRATTMDGRSLGSLGPVVLGTRLAGNHGGLAYQAIVYDKGAAVFSTLAQRLGSEPTWEMLGALAQTVNNRVIRTSTFFRALEHMSGQDLGGFVGRYVHGDGMPAVFYDHRFRQTDAGDWIAEGRITQLPAERLRYVVERAGGGWDVVRRTADEDVSDWNTVIPFYVEMTPPAPGDPPRAMAGKVTVEGETSSFSIALDAEPTGFLLDPFGQILADVRAEGSDAKRHLCEVGEHLARLGRFDESLETLGRALEARAATDEAATDRSASEPARELDARIRLARARVFLDRGDTASARTELQAVEKLLGKASSYYAGERAVLQARLHLRSGRSGLALAALNDYLNEKALVLEFVHEERLLDPSGADSLKVSRGEILALLAVASFQTGDRDAPMLVRMAGLTGVDMRALGLSSH